LNKLPGRYTLRFQRVPQTCVGAGPLMAVTAANTCDTTTPAVNEYLASACGVTGTDGDDKTYYLEKCPGPGISVDTCAGRTGNTDTVLQINRGSMDQNATTMACAITATGLAIACNDDTPAGSCAADATNTHVSAITNAGRGERGIFAITVDVHPTPTAAGAVSLCGVYGLNESLVP
jgi:hypothetical protein